MVIQCYWCGKDKEIADKEFKRQIKKGRGKFFCSLSCGGQYRNSIYNPTRPVIDKICPECGKPFKTKDIARQPTFCSRLCASKGSVTELRQQAAIKVGLQNSVNFVHTQQGTLKKREAWKYAQLELTLQSMNKLYEFEFCFDNMQDFIYDLALFTEKLIIEFDSNYHNWSKQQIVDKQKEEFAQSQGWKVIRIATDSNCVIEPDCIAHLFPPAN